MSADLIAAGLASLAIALVNQDPTGAALGIVLVWAIIYYPEWRGRYL